MNKKILILSVCIICVLTLTLGLAFAKNFPKKPTEDLTTVPTSEMSKETTIPLTQEVTVPYSSTQEVSTIPPSQQSDESRITPEKAFSIALGDSGFAESEIWDKDVDLDFERGQLVYEVSFEKDNIEYDYVINAQNGEIIHSKEPVSNPVSTTSAHSDTAGRITAEQARSIALEAAGFESSEVWDKEIELDYEKGILVYEVSFEKGNTDYEYIINAHSGEIVRTEVDPY